jgi:hypothetical protein
MVGIEVNGGTESLLLEFSRGNVASVRQNAGQFVPILMQSLVNRGYAYEQAMNDELLNIDGSSFSGRLYFDEYGELVLRCVGHGGGFSANMDDIINVVSVIQIAINSLQMYGGGKKRNTRSRRKRSMRSKY